jgi:hypothetical protein
MTPKEHAQRLVDMYRKAEGGDPHESTDHGVASAVAYLDLLIVADELRISQDNAVAEERRLRGLYHDKFAETEKANQVLDELRRVVSHIDGKAVMQAREECGLAAVIKTDWRCVDTCDNDVRESGG